MDTKYNNGTKFLLVKDLESLQHPKQAGKKKKRKVYTKVYTACVYYADVIVLTTGHLQPPSECQSFCLHAASTRHQRSCQKQSVRSWECQWHPAQWPQTPTPGSIPTQQLVWLCLCIRASFCDFPLRYMGLEQSILFLQVISQALSPCSSTMSQSIRYFPPAWWMLALQYLIGCWQLCIWHPHPGDHDCQAPFPSRCLSRWHPPVGGKAILFWQSSLWLPASGSPLPIAPLKPRPCQTKGTRLFRRKLCSPHFTEFLVTSLKFQP